MGKGHGGKSLAGLGALMCSTQVPANDDWDRAHDPFTGAVAKPVCQQCIVLCIKGLKIKNPQATTSMMWSFSELDTQSVSNTQSFGPNAAIIHRLCLRNLTSALAGAKLGELSAAAAQRWPRLTTGTWCRNGSQASMIPCCLPSNPDQTPPQLATPDTVIGRRKA